MLNCKQASELMSQGMDAELPLVKKMSLRLHLMMCDGCSGFLAQIRFLRMAAKRLKERSNQSIPQLSAEARERIAKALSEHLKSPRPPDDVR